MPLDVSATVSDITSALAGQPPTADETTRWTAIVTALYDRIKSDILITSVVSTTGGPTAQTGTGIAGGGSGSVT